MPTTPIPDPACEYPLVRDGSERRTSGVVLFDLPAECFASFAADLRRLTNRPLQFHWPLAGRRSDRVLIRIEAPPALLVARVVDATIQQKEDESSPSVAESGGSRPPLAFVEQSPGVWVPIGNRHLASDPSRPSVGRWLFLHGPDQREEIEAAEFVGEIELLDLGVISGTPAEGKCPRVATELRLLPTTAHDPARLWVLRDDALGRLAAYCRSANEILLDLFSVAVSASAGMPCVVLRAAGLKGLPPEFIGPAEAYRPYLPLANLYLPTGTRLGPPVRRDAIRAVLGLKADRVVWLHAIGGGAFRAESLSEAAFVPLQQWVDYRTPSHTRPAQVWSQSHAWELGSFVERREEPQRQVRQPTDRPLARRNARPIGLVARALRWFKSPLDKPATKGNIIPAEPSIPFEAAIVTALDRGGRLHLARPETTSGALERVRVFEARFLSNASGTGKSEDDKPWAELAAAYDAAGNTADASICWLNALWGQPKLSTLWAWGWLRAEAKSAGPDVLGVDPAVWLAVPPSPGTTRAAAAWAVWASLQVPPPTALAALGPNLQARLEEYEHWLPVRAAWLARVALSRIGRGDALGLARTRDRLTERIRAAGLSLDLDAPSFVRFAGEGVRERFHEARRWLTDKRELIHQWLSRLPLDAGVQGKAGPGAERLQRFGLEPDVANTRAYADWIIAWGLARFAEAVAVDAVRAQAIAARPVGDPVHDLLGAAFEFRVAQVRDGKPPRGPLPVDLLVRIAALDSVPRYAVEKLREFSRVLEPTVRVDTYPASIFRSTVPAPGGLRPVVVEAMPADRLNQELGSWLRTEADREGRPHLVAVVSATLDRAWELTEEAADALFAILSIALDAERDAPRPLARLIEKGFAAAAVCDRPAAAKDLAARFLRLADGRAGWDVAEALTGQAFRALLKLGLKADADRVLHHVAERVLRGDSLARLRVSRPAEWPAALRVLLHAAAGWYYAGKGEQAHAILDEARNDLFAPETSVPNRTALALAYAHTLGQAPVRVALGRLEEMFQRLKGITVGGTTNAYYSLKPLILIETAVRAIVSDDFALGPAVRTWLDADEFAVRRRIRDDLKDAMEAQGL